MAWTYTDNYNILPNLYVRSKFLDGVLKFYEIFPVTGYVLWIPKVDEYEYDEDGNPVYDEDGNPVLLYHYYSWGGATAMPNYDFEANVDGFQAVPYEEGMRVFGTSPIPDEKE